MKLQSLVSLLVPLFIPLFVLFLAVIGLNMDSCKELFYSYKMYPYGEVYTGSDPLYFYNYDRYRKPYRYGYYYFKSYPYSHMAPLP